MTNEEAIAYGEDYLRDLSSYATCKISERHVNFVKMAIEALKAETCEDAVSRDAVHDMLENVPIRPDDKWFNWLQKACLRLAELPPVTPKQDWIPVDQNKYPEGYPRAFQEVWVTDNDGSVYRCSYGGRRAIKAWMPYISPMPYEEEDEK